MNIQILHNYNIHCENTAYWYYETSYIGCCCSLVSNVHESIVFHKHAKVVDLGNIMYLSPYITYIDRDLVKKIQI